MVEETIVAVEDLTYYYKTVNVRTPAVKLSLLKGVSKFFGTILKVVEIIKLPMDVIQAAVFNLFIFEEALQTSGFGIYTAMQAKDWDEADRQITNMLGIYGAAMVSFNTSRTIIRTTVGVMLGVIGEFIIEGATGVSVVDAVEEYFLMPFASFFASVHNNIKAYDEAIKAGRAKEAHTSSLETGARIW